MKVVIIGGGPSGFSAAMVAKKVVTVLLIGEDIERVRDFYFSQGQ